MILKLEDQVCVYSLAVRLKELGAPQESLYYWRGCSDGQKTWWEISYVQVPGVMISAYTVAELGKLLPQVIKLVDGHKYILVTGQVFNGLGWQVGYRGQGNVVIHFEEALEVQARAKALIHLAEQGLVKFAEVQ